MRHWKTIAAIFTLLVITSGLTACGFHLQKNITLANPLHRMYLQTQDPYGPLARHLQDYLKMSNVQLVSSPNLATTILNIQHDSTSQSLLSVSGTQQTRQYNLAVNVTFVLTDNKGTVLLPEQTLSEARTITIQSNQILGSSNETTIIYQQIRRSLASAIINRLSSQETTDTINKIFQKDENHRHVTSRKQKTL